MTKRAIGLLVIVLVLALSFLLRDFYRPFWEPLYFRMAGLKTVDSVAAGLEPEVSGRLHPVFDAAGVHFPPSSLAFIILKEERQLQVWASDDGPWKHVCAYDVLGASGKPGPKLREGDLQVPEGMYQIAALHPNSQFHLSLKLDYPNAFDRQKAIEDGRTQLGDEIFIHGGGSSIGCIAIGDSGIEDLFFLVDKVGCDSIEVIIAPRDFRSMPWKSGEYDGPKWLDKLYEEISAGLESFGTAAAR
ncbi:MAG: hypothetical protein IT365_01260 [Candidatus Hydrogenedentes bacterium]|nr:hypothetical protein [Candidatus Hydrogenedentota bacterium]